MSAHPKTAVTACGLPHARLELEVNLRNASCYANLDQDLFEEVQTKMRDPAFRQKRSERMWKSEGAVCRGEAESLPGARQVPRPVQSANSGLPQRDRPEPEAPRRANLLLARGLLVTQANKISLIAEVDEFRDRLFQQAPKRLQSVPGSAHNWLGNPPLIKNEFAILVSNPVDNRHNGTTGTILGLKSTCGLWDNEP